MEVQEEPSPTMLQECSLFSSYPWLHLAPRMSCRHIYVNIPAHTSKLHHTFQKLMPLGYLSQRCRRFIHRGMDPGKRSLQSPEARSRLSEQGTIGSESMALKEGYGLLASLFLWFHRPFIL